MLQTVSRAKLQDFLSPREYRHRVQTLLQARRRHLASTAWFQKSYPQAPLTRVADFSMEFGLSEALPIYSGGLGNVAGDQLKAACDLGVPVIGVGLPYQRGYFRQVIRADGSQEALYPYNDPGQLPISPVRDDAASGCAWSFPRRGTRSGSDVAGAGRTAHPLPARQQRPREPAGLPRHHERALRWRPGAAPAAGAGAEHRGWRLLRTLGLEPEVCHLNEGHAALAVLERARSFMEESGCRFDVALAVTRVGNVFTTHTPVPAGFDRFAPSLIARYLGRYVEEDLGISLHDLLALGRENPGILAKPSTWPTSPSIRAASGST